MDDVALHAFTGGEPASVEQLRSRYARQAVGHSPDGGQGWLNWVIRVTASGEAAGFVQATLERATLERATLERATLERDEGRTTASVAWVVAVPFQGRGYASEAAAGMLGWLRTRGTDRFVAWIHPEHAASAGVARRLGLLPTSEVEDGELAWRSPAPA